MTPGCRCQRRVMRVSGAWQRILLIAVAAGVIGMHTLGHVPGMSGMSTVARSPAVVHVAGGTGAQHGPLAAEGRGLAHHRLPWTDPACACLAILGLLAAGAMMRRAGAAAALRPGGLPGRRVPLPLPPRPPRFAEQLVLRI